jgi:hypothetical protein
MFSFSHDFGDFIGDALCGHFGLLVVCRYLWGRDHMSLLVLELFFDPAVEEESNMRVLLGL